MLSCELPEHVGLRACRTLHRTVLTSRAHLSALSTSEDEIRDSSSLQGVMGSSQCLVGWTGLLQLILSAPTET